jgi:UDPglucose 6-dehydrogenase
MNICVIGAGYVGLATSVLFAKQGHRVICADSDGNKVIKTRLGEISFYEPSLEKAIRILLKRGLLSVDTDVARSVKYSRIIFICVNTPSLDNGAIDLKPLENACRDIGRVLKTCHDFKVIVVKSTVVPSTTDKIIIPILERRSGKKVAEDFGVCVNPEFLREGNALRDTLDPARVVIGSMDRRSKGLLTDIYKELPVAKICVSLRAAEMIKYASNSFIALKISFANEVADVCGRFGIEVTELIDAVGLDPRIGPSLLRPSLGFGGSCLEKDIRALIASSKMAGYSPVLMLATLAVNDNQPFEGVRDLERVLGTLKGKRISVLGLAFKGGVDDVRGTRALPLIRELKRRGAQVIAYDPKAMRNFARIMPRIEYANSASASLRGADACIIQADWPEFRKLGKKEFSRMKSAVVYDGVRLLVPNTVEKQGGIYLGIGRGRVSTNRH